MTGYAFHPEAASDLDEIWEFIAQDNLDAADNVIEDIWPGSTCWCLSLIRGINAQT